MKITVYLVSDSGVPCWTFNKEDQAYLISLLPKEKIVIVENKQSFLKELEDSEIVIVWYFSQEWLQIGKKLKWIVTPAAGKDFFHIDTDIEMDYGSFHGEIMAETVVGMILANVRGIKESILLQKEDNWPRKKIWQDMKPLKSSQIIILGFGSIGIRIAKLLKPFGVKITAIKRTLNNAPDFFDKNDKLETIDNLDLCLPTCDHLILCLPATKETDNIIDKKRFGLLPPTSYIYNVGRGNAINEDDLCDAIEKKEIKGAFIDVFKNEPLSPESRLRKYKEISIMPHASAISPNYLTLFIEEFVARFKKKYQ